MTKLQIDKRSPDKKTFSILYATQNIDGESKTHFLIAIATIIAVCSAIIGGLLFERYLKSFHTAEIDKSSNRNLVAAPTSTTKAQPADLVQPALGDRVRVTIIAVKRIPGKPDEVNVEMQIEKLIDTELIEDTISVGSTMASNSETSEIYRATDFRRRSSGRVSLRKLRQDKPVDAYVVLDVPNGVTTIDLFVDKTTPFKNVPIAPANQFRVVSGAATTNATARRTISHPTIEPTGLIRKALDNKAQVQVISAQRLKNPDLSTRNVMNLKMRIWRLGTKQPNFQDVITVSATTARNPDTSDTYRAFDFLNRATNPVFLFYLRPQTYTDAYVWLQVPEGVNTLDIFVPETGTFRNVPISNN